MRNLAKSILTALKSPVRRRSLVVWGFSLLLLALLPATALADDPCGAGNLLPNCGFDTFQGEPPRQVPSGWTPFILSGDLTFMQDTDTMYAAPSLRMWSSWGTFTAGIFTQVGGLQPGAAYIASIGWGGPNAPETFGRRLGIDPTGGTDPASPNVVWGPLHYGPGRVLNRPGPHSPDKPNLDVAAVAQSPTVTVFVWVEHPNSTGDNLIFIDNVGLRQDSSAPVAPTATPAPPTAVAAAPTATRIPAAPPTATASPTPTAAPTATASPSPTATASPTPSPTPTASPSPTPTASPSPTVTPTPWPTSRPRATATPLPFWLQASQAGQRQPHLLLYAGFIFLAGAAGLGGLAWYSTRR